MKPILKLSVLMLAAMLLTTPYTFAGGKGYGGGGNPVPTLTTAEEQGLLQMREEEKLARDVYLFLHDLWGQPIFQNISESEQRHMDAILNLLKKYGLHDPASGKAQGEFSDTHIQLLYNTLTGAGSLSQVEALRVGATIEDLDIFDLEELVADTDTQDITRVYLNLLKGSRNHLRSFTDQLESLGETYTAQYLTQEEVDEIINSPKERGRF
jgi:hypothetical protein